MRSNIRKRKVPDTDTNVIKFPLVFITWVDAESANGWSSQSEVKAWAAKDAEVKDIGWIVERNKKQLVLCSQIGDSDLGNRTKIPLRWIRSIKKVRVCGGDYRDTAGKNRRNSARHGQKK